MSDSEAPLGNPTLHFEIVSRNGKNKIYKCKFCAKEFAGSGTRCYVHLTGEGKGVGLCDKAPADVVQACKAAKAKKDAEENLKRKAAEDTEERKRARASQQQSSSTPTGPAARAPSAASGEVRARMEPEHKHGILMYDCLANYL